MIRKSNLSSALFRFTPSCTIFATDMRSYNHIFIDLDDTVWDFNANSHIALALTYENLHLHNICSDYDRFSSLYYAKNAELWNLYHHGEISRDFLIIERFAFPLRECGYIDKENKLATHINKCYLETLSLQTKLVPQAYDMLCYLRDKNYKLYILSNGFIEVQARKLQAGGIEQFFSRIVLSDEIGINKPDHRIFDYALEVTGSDAASSLMIGDNYDTDIMGAAHAGWGQIYFDRYGKGYTGEAPQHTIHSLSEISLIL